MNAPRKLIAALAIAIAMITPARSTDFTDLWWNPHESGWGLNIAHQADIMYLTLYVFGSNGRATWYSVQASFTGTDSAGNLVYTGELYEVTGPWFGGLFDPKAVMVRTAGDATFRASSVQTGNLTYTVDGLVTSKDIERYTLKHTDLTGDYIGGVVQTNANCANPALNGRTEDAAFLSIAHDDPGIQIVATSVRRTCTYSGTYGQAGRLGSVGNATFSCTDGTVGAFSAFEIDTASSGFLARFAGAASGCTFSGDMGGVFR
jgi:hypothetical protein